MDIESCVRFTRLERLPLDVIERAVRRMSVEEYIAVYEASRRRSQDSSMIWPAFHPPLTGGTVASRSTLTFDTSGRCHWGPERHCCREPPGRESQPAPGQPARCGQHNQRRVVLVTCTRGPVHARGIGSMAENFPIFAGTGHSRLTLARKMCRLARA